MIKAEAIQKSRRIAIKMVICKQKITAKRKNTSFILFPSHIYVHKSKVKQREERRWLRQDLLATAIFSFGCNSVEQVEATKIQFSLAG